MRRRGPPDDQDQCPALDTGEGVAGEYQEIDAEIQERAENVRHDQADEGTQTGEKAEQQQKDEIGGDGVPRKGGAHYQPEDEGGQQGIEGDDGPEGDVAVPREDAQAVDEGTNAVVIGELVQE